jgi:hypothetical protein
MLLSTDSHSMFHVILKEIELVMCLKKITHTILSLFKCEEGLDEAPEECVEPSTENFVCSHNLRGGSNPHVMSVVYSLHLDFFTPFPRIGCKTTQHALSCSLCSYTI